MPQAELLRRQAEACMAEVYNHESCGRHEEMLAPLQRAVLLYAAADAALDLPDPDSPLKRARADACRRYAEALSDAQRHAEAAHIYQEATDLFGAMEDQESQKAAGDCARRLLDNVAALRARPNERLQLLVARYERELQQLALQPDSEAEQAECCTHIARIYQRRDRPADSVARYREALEHHDRCPVSAEREMARAECHHRIATLQALQLQNPREAIRHYRQAILLYQEHEPTVYGFQQSLELCRAALARTESIAAQIDKQRDREWSHE